MMKSVKAEIEDKLKTLLDCFMQVAMTLRTDQAQLRTDQVQLQTDQETIITTFVQVGEKTKTRFKDLENVQASFIEENAKLKGVMATMMRTTANEIAKLKGEMATMMRTIANGIWTSKVKDLENVQANFVEENPKLKREMATMMRTTANEVWRSQASRFFGMAEARIDTEIERVRSMLCLGEISDEEFGDSDNGG